MKREQARAVRGKNASPDLPKPGPGEVPAGEGLSLRMERSFSSPGGGAMPEVEIPTVCIAVSHARIRIEELDARLRAGKTPVVGRVAKGRLLLDMRTVRDEELPALAAALVAASGGPAPPEVIDPERRGG